jgi:hypothetical protein
LLLTNADNYVIIRDITKATFNWGNRQHPKTKGNKMNENKQIKSDLWDVYYKLEEAGASKVVKYAIIDVMILMDKEAEKNSDLLDSALDI